MCFSQVLFYANILAGELDSPHLRTEDTSNNTLSVIPEDSLLDDISASKSSRPPQAVDPLENELQLVVLDSRKPFIPFHEFYNESLSDFVEMARDIPHGNA